VTLTKEKIYSAILQKIESGEYPPDSKMPTERELAAKYKTTLWTIHTIMNELEENKFIERRRSAGTFVCGNISIQKVKRLKNKDSKNIWAVVPKDFFFIRKGYEDIIGLMECALNEKGFNVSYEELPDNRKAVRKFLEAAAASEVRAIVIFPEWKEWNTMHECVDIFDEFPGEIYYFNRGIGPSDDLPFSGVVLDTCHGGTVAAKWIIEKGFERVLFTGMDNSSKWWFKTRLYGFKRLFDIMGKKFDVILKEATPDLMTPLLDYVKNSSKVPAIAVPTEDDAIILYNFLETNGLKACRDFYMLSFSNNPEGRHYKMVNVFWNIQKAALLLAEAIAENKSALFNEVSTLKLQIKPILNERKIKVELK